MSSKVFSAALVGLDCRLIEVEADTAVALPNIFIVGLPDKAVDESRDRVRSAIKNAGWEVPRTKVTVNLAPADLKKQGPAYDVPIAVSILTAAKQLRPSVNWRQQLFVGELALNGDIRSINGVLAIAASAQQLGIRELFVPAANAAEAVLIDGITVYACATLAALLNHLDGKQMLEAYRRPADPWQETASEEVGGYDMAHVRGQEHVKRALEIAAAGGHNILMSGPPGSGKTLLAKTLVTILPDMLPAEALLVTRVYSVAGLLSQQRPLVRSRPFRSPHHTTSSAALVGGGAWPRPGEISLAHRGVLFLDEFPEFSRIVLEALRQPLEDGVITVSRASGSLQFPAQVMLVAAMNPCPCGYAGDTQRNCTCSTHVINKYRKRLSGPLLDRIDLHVSVPKVEVEKLVVQGKSGESSATIRQRVIAARQRQSQRYTGTPLLTNADLSSRHVRQYCHVADEAALLLRQAISQFQLSARAYFRLLKLAQTIADLAAAEIITIDHVAEALQYRSRQE